MPRRNFAWASLSDEWLLKIRLKDLKVTVEGTWLEDCVHNLRDELEERGIRVRPHNAWYRNPVLPGPSTADAAGKENDHRR